MTSSAGESSDARASSASLSRRAGSGQCRSATASTPDTANQTPRSFPVRGIGLGEDPGLQRFDELPVDQTRVELASAQAIPAAP